MIFSEYGIGFHECIVGVLDKVENGLQHANILHDENSEEENLIHYVTNKCIIKYTMYILRGGNLATSP